MPGPQPKYPEQRRRTNPPASGEWVTLPAEPFEGPRPETPAFQHAETAETWNLWWKSPMAHMWTEGDWPSLLRLIELIDNRQDLNDLKEIRMQEDRFGLSPKGRQSLHWRFAPEGKAPSGKVLEGRWQKLQVVDAVPASN